MKKESEETLAAVVREYFEVKKLGRAKMFSLPEGKKRRKELQEKMAKLAGYKL